MILNETAADMMHLQFPLTFTVCNSDGDIASNEFYTLDSLNTFLSTVENIVDFMLFNDGTDFYAIVR